MTTDGAAKSNGKNQGALKASSQARCLQRQRLTSLGDIIGHVHCPDCSKPFAPRELGRIGKCELQRKNTQVATAKAAHDKIKLSYTVVDGPAVIDVHNSPLPVDESSAEAQRGD